MKKTLRKEALVRESDRPHRKKAEDKISRKEPEFFLENES
jgi:hypothetical protein